MFLLGVRALPGLGQGHLLLLQKPTYFCWTLKQAGLLRTIPAWALESTSVGWVGLWKLSCAFVAWILPLSASYFLNHNKLRLVFHTLYCLGHIFKSYLFSGKTNETTCLAFSYLQTPFPPLPMFAKHCSSPTKYSVWCFLLWPEILTRSSLAVILCCFWLWAVDALWQLTIIFHIHTLAYPHSLPRQFPLAKLPSSFSHIFSMFFFVLFPLIQHHYPVFWKTKTTHCL